MSHPHRAKWQENDLLPGESKEDCVRRMFVLVVLGRALALDEISRVDGVKQVEIDGFIRALRKSCKGLRDSGFVY